MRKKVPLAVGHSQSIIIGGTAAGKELRMSMQRGEIS